MESDFSIREALKEPQFKTFFLDLLQRTQSGEEAYQQLLAYFLPQEIQRGRALVEPLAPGNQTCGQENDVVLSMVADSVQRAVLRLKRSQQEDGGWGPRTGESDFWHTAHAVLCISAARACMEMAYEPELLSILQRGYAYLEQHPEYWAADMIPVNDGLSVYDLCLMVRCFFRGGREFLRRETIVRIYRGIDHLAHAQNDDGGWDASLWGYDVATPIRLFSEVGATSYAVQALAEVCSDRFIPALQKGVHWLAQTQNMDGSWNNGSTRPDLPNLTLSGDPRIDKTCYALQGILCLQDFELSVESYIGTIYRTVDYLMHREQPILDKRQHPSAWGWGFTAADYEHIDLILETLLRLPGAPLPLLFANAEWLMQSQRRQSDDMEDGSWVLGNTARIANTLIDYYRRMRDCERPANTYHNWLP